MAKKKPSHCRLCQLEFPTTTSLLAHCASTPNHSLSSACDCDGCNPAMSSLATDDPRRLYRLSGRPGPRFCHPCGTTVFLCGAGKRTHLASPAHHKNALAHNLICPDSQKSFLTPSTFAVHERRYHQGEYRCLECGAVLPSLCALRRHPMHHRRECSDCGMEFEGAEEYEAHVATKRHRINATGKVRCVAYPACSRRFTNRGSMLAHLESGACVSGVTRGRVEEVVGKAGGEVLRIGRGATGGGDGQGSGAEVLPVAISTVSPPTVFTTVTIPDSLMPLDQPPLSGFRHICHICNKVFTSAGELRGHISGLAHAPRIYRCPTIKKKKEFKSLSGLVMHLESKAGRRRGGRKALEFVEGVGLARLVLT